MEKRQPGRSSLHVYPITFGGNVFGWTADEAMSFKLLDAFVAGGFNFVDSADAYSRWHPGNSGGESETIIGRWLKARGGRDKVIIDWRDRLLFAGRRLFDGQVPVEGRRGGTRAGVSR